MLGNLEPGEIIPHIPIDLIPSTNQYSYYGMSGYSGSSGVPGLSGFSGYRTTSAPEYDPQYTEHSPSSVPLCTDKNWQKKQGSEKPKKKHWLAKLWRV